MLLHSPEALALRQAIQIASQMKREHLAALLIGAGILMLLNSRTQ